MVGCQVLIACDLLSPIAMFHSVGNDASQFVCAGVSPYPFDELRASLKLASTIADLAGKCRDPVGVSGSTYSVLRKGVQSRGSGCR